MRVCSNAVVLLTPIEVAADLARRLAVRTVHGPMVLCDADVIRRLWIEEFHAGERAA